jgi:diacylglycerol kinase family enzyme
LTGRNRRGLQSIRRVEAEHPWMPARDVCTPHDVRAALGEFARAEVDVVALNGGDGTIQAALTILLGPESPFERPPLLAALPAGTTALIAGDVGLPGRCAEGLRRLLAWAHAGSPEAAIVERPVLRMRAEDTPEPAFGMFFGAASILRGVEYAVTRVHPLGIRGELGAGLAFCRMLGRLARGRHERLSAISVEAAIDGGPPERRDCLVVLVTTLRRLFLGLRPYWGSEPGPLHYTAVAARPRHLLRVLPSLLRGRASRHGTPEHGYVSRNAHEIRLSVSGGFMLDGEVLGKRDGPETVVLDEGGRVAFVRC